MNRSKWSKYKEIWSETSICCRCHIKYTELTNIGRWQCKRHKGYKILSEKQSNPVLTSGGTYRSYDYRWSCCPEVRWTADHANGCTPCDHSESTMRNDAIMEGIFIGWLEDLDPISTSIVNISTRDFVDIKRTQ